MYNNIEQAISILTFLHIYEVAFQEKKARSQKELDRADAANSKRDEREDEEYKYNLRMKRRQEELSFQQNANNDQSLWQHNQQVLKAQLQERESCHDYDQFKKRKRVKFVQREGFLDGMHDRNMDLVSEKSYAKVTLSRLERRRKKAASSSSSSSPSATMILGSTAAATASASAAAGGGVAAAASAAAAGGAAAENSDNSSESESECDSDGNDKDCNEDYTKHFAS